MEGSSLVCRSLGPGAVGGLEGTREAEAVAPPALDLHLWLSCLTMAWPWGDGEGDGAGEAKVLLSSLSSGAAQEVLRCFVYRTRRDFQALPLLPPLPVSSSASMAAEAS